MTSENYNLRILFRLLLFALTTTGLVYFIFVDLKLEFIVIFSVLIIVETISFIYFLNGVNRKLSFFFDAIRNEDTTLKFPENVKNKSLRGLYKSFNNLNKTISEIKIKSETNERFFRELIEHSTTGLMSVDQEGYVDIINQQAKKYLGVVQLSNILLLQQINTPVYNVIKTIKPGEKTILKQAINQNLVNLSIQSSEVNFGEKYFQLISIQDIRYEMEENEIDSWQKLIRVMTHEIMNSIAPITSLTNTLIGFLRSGEHIRQPEDLSKEDINNTLTGLTIIEERGKGLIHFVDNYRKLTKVPNPIFAPMDVCSWSESLEFLFRPLLKENKCQFQCRIESGIKAVLTDEKLFNQVMINLMTNAIDAIKQNDNDNPPKITLIIRPASTHSTLFELTDNGCGISESVMDKIFVPFFTTKEGGNGIGLSLSRQIVRKLNGKIYVRSAENKGSRFVVEI
jgi:two-component system, NtrC family, nitrogen regulation sensor histidine kinase NtrY